MIESLCVRKEKLLHRQNDGNSNSFGLINQFNGVRRRIIKAPGIYLNHPIIKSIMVSHLKLIRFKFVRMILIT